MCGGEETDEEEKKAGGRIIFNDINTLESSHILELLVSGDSTGRT